MKTLKNTNNLTPKKRNILLPAIVFYIINTFVYLLQQPDAPLFGFLISSSVYNLISQGLAYLTCYFIVIKRNKGQKGVWINYIIWTVVMNLGVVSEMLNK